MSRFLIFSIFTLELCNLEIRMQQGIDFRHRSSDKCFPEVFECLPNFSPHHNALHSHCKHNDSESKFTALHLELLVSVSCSG